MGFFFYLFKCECCLWSVTLNSQPAALGLLAPCGAALINPFVRLGSVRKSHQAVGAAVDFASVPVEVEGAAGGVELVPAAQGHSSPFGDRQGRALQEHVPICNTNTTTSESVQFSDSSPVLFQLPGTYQWLWCWHHCCFGHPQTDTSTRHCQSDRLFWWRRWSPRRSQRWSPRWSQQWSPRRSMVWRCPLIIFSGPSICWWRRPGPRRSVRWSHIWRTVSCPGSAGDRLRREGWRRVTRIIEKIKVMGECMHVCKKKHKRKLLPLPHTAINKQIQYKHNLIWRVNDDLKHRSSYSEKQKMPEIEDQASKHTNTYTLTYMAWSFLYSHSVKQKGVSCILSLKPLQFCWCLQLLLKAKEVAWNRPTFTFLLKTGCVMILEEGNKNIID